MDKAGPFRIIELIMTVLHDFHANLELQHIYLEAYAERYHYLRQYFESYYCYRHRLLTRNGKADWELIFDHSPRSDAAVRLKDRKQLVRELRMPLSVLTGKLKVLVRDDELSIDAIRKLLDEHLDYVILTRAEWQKLKSAGLQERMPAEYYQQVSKDYLDTGARFRAVGIELTD